jgi:hypothetical protein
MRHPIIAASGFILPAILVADLLIQYRSISHATTPS